MSVPARKLPLSGHKMLCLSTRKNDRSATMCCILVCTVVLFLSGIFLSEYVTVVPRINRSFQTFTLDKPISSIPTTTVTETTNAGNVSKLQTSVTSFSSQMVTAVSDKRTIKYLDSSANTYTTKLVYVLKTREQTTAEDISHGGISVPTVPMKKEAQGSSSVSATNNVSKLQPSSTRKISTKQTQPTMIHTSSDNGDELTTLQFPTKTSTTKPRKISTKQTQPTMSHTSSDNVGNLSTLQFPTTNSTTNPRQISTKQTQPMVNHISLDEVRNFSTSPFPTTKKVTVPQSSSQSREGSTKQTQPTTRPTSLLKPACTELIEGKKEAFINSEKYFKLNPYKSTTNFTTEAEDCQSFIHKRGYIFNTSSEERDFSVAYSIITFKDVEQVELLLRAIYRPSNLYCVHMDRNASAPIIQEMEAVVKCFPNVFFSSRQISVKWGYFSVLEVELICMKELLKNLTWKYFINLTGQEFPLKTNLELVRILKILNGSNSVDANNQGRWFHMRWKPVWPPPHNIQPYKGNVHVVLSRGFVDYAINNPVAKTFTQWLKRTEIPDESFFSSLDNNPHLKVPGSNTGKFQSTDYDKKPYIARFKNWGKGWGERSFDWPCAGKRVRGVCVFGVGDLKLLTSRRELFANKFHIDYQPQTLQCMYEWHRNRSIMEMEGKTSMSYDFYKNMPQLKSVYKGN